jgi:hypothetical protein
MLTDRRRTTDDGRKVMTIAHLAKRLKKVGCLRRLDRIIPAHLFRASLSQVFHHKTMLLLSAKCNGKVRVTARKQIIQKLCEHVISL